MTQLLQTYPMVAFQATINAGAETVKSVDIRIEVDSGNDFVCLSVADESFEMVSPCKSKGLAHRGENAEHIRYLHGPIPENQEGMFLVLVVNCGQEPPQFTVMQCTASGIPLKGKNYTITHQIQDRINHLIDASDLNVKPPNIRWITL